MQTHMEKYAYYASYFTKFAISIVGSFVILFGLSAFFDSIFPTGRIPGAAPVPEAAAPAAPEAPAASAPAPAPAPVAAKPEEPELPLEALLAKANVEAGQNTAKVCTTCHNFAKGAGPKIGPELYGVVGRGIAKEPGFAYSDALKGKGGTWTFENLFQWTRNPKAFVPGNKMLFVGIKGAQDRANVIAYLDTLSDNPVPLPKK